MVYLKKILIIEKKQIPYRLVADGAGLQCGSNQTLQFFGLNGRIKLGSCASNILILEIPLSSIAPCHL